MRRPPNFACAPDNSDLAIQRRARLWEALTARDSYPGLNDPDLRTETALNVASLLGEHTKVFYTGAHGVHLPEGYNGLGARNLIYILLQLLSSHKSFRTNPTLPAVHLIFIEEPEAHLHPQMQEVFIKQLNAAVQVFSAEYPDQEWPVQFVVTTHSSHIANAAPFDAVRYFLAKPPASAIFSACLWSFPTSVLRTD